MKQYEFISRNYYLYFLFLFFSLFFFSFKYFSIQPIFLDRITAAILFPIIKLQSSVARPIQGYWNKKNNLLELSQHINQLQKQNEDLLKENIQLKASSIYYNDTKELDRFRKRYQDYVCTAQIILRQFSDKGQYIFIDQGKNSGVMLDMIAVYKNSVLGRVDKVYGNYSRIILVTDSSCKIAAICSSNKIKGIYEGRAQQTNDLNSAELMHIDHLQNTKEEDLILSNGEGLIYPAGFSLGRITSIAKDGVNQKITIKPLHDLSKIDYCYLIKSKLND